MDRQNYNYGDIDISSITTAAVFEVSNYLESLPFSVIKDVCTRMTDTTGIFTAEDTLGPFNELLHKKIKTTAMRQLQVDALTAEVYISSFGFSNPKSLENTIVSLL